MENVSFILQRNKLLLKHNDCKEKNDIIHNDLIMKKYFSPKLSHTFSYPNQKLSTHTINFSVAVQNIFTLTILQSAGITRPKTCMDFGIFSVNRVIVYLHNTTQSDQLHVSYSTKVKALQVGNFQKIPDRNILRCNFGGCSGP